MSKVVFLLGAGASADAGFPMMAELTELFRKDLARSTNLSNRQALLAAWDSAVASVAGASPNIEHVLQLLADVEALKGRRGVIDTWSGPFRVDSVDLEVLSSHAREFIRRTLSKAASDRSDYLHGLLDFRDEDAVDVFTLNYDRLVEDMAVRFDVRYTTGFAETWDPQLFSLPGLQLRLHKLHGSVDWYRLVGRNVVYRGSAEHPAFGGEPTTDVLLYPTRGKNAFADPFATLVSRFNESLGRATHCVALGYSFRDAHIRRLILDRLVTNRELQLLVVDPQAEAVLTIDAEEPGEPTFSQVADRVSGLWQRAKYALENRMIRFRLDEIAATDSQIGRAIERRNARQFRESASILMASLDACRLKHLSHKPRRFLGEPFGDELRQELGRSLKERLRGQASTLRISLDKGDENWKNVGPEAMALSLGIVVSDWLVAVGLGLQDRATEARDLIAGMVRRYAAGIMFVHDGEWHVWGEAYPLRTVEGDLGIRVSQMRACSKHLAEWPPITASEMAKGTAAVDELEKLENAFTTLVPIHERLMEMQPKIQIAFGTVAAFVPQVPDWVPRMGLVSDNFFASSAAETWLGPPGSSGKL